MINWFVRLLENQSTLVLTGAGLVAVAFLVNWLAPHQRRRVRRAVVLFGLCVAAAVAARMLATLEAFGWASYLGIARDLLQVFTVINLFALATFDLCLPRLKVEPVSITSDLLTGVAYVVAAIGTFRHAGMDLSSVIATSAVVSGILALSLQATLGNILGGVALQLDGSVHVGDWLQLENGRQGRVREIRWRHTVLETRDWDTIIVPNASLLSSNIVILGKRQGEPVQHRMTLYFSVDLHFAPTRVIDVVNEALRASPIEGVVDRPLAHCLLYDLAHDGRDGSAFYAVRYWLTDLDRDDTAQSRVRSRVYSGLRRAGIPFGRPVGTLYLRRDDGEGELGPVGSSRERRLAALASLDLFKVLPEAQRQELVDELRHTPFVRDEVVMRSGTEATAMYILVEGEVEVRTSDGTGASRVVARMRGPNFFGEMGLMTGERRSADVVATTDVDCYELDRGAFERILLAHPEIASLISSTLAHRRVELIAAQEGLDASSRQLREATEQARILKRIQNFFGLAG